MAPHRQRASSASRINVRKYKSRLLLLLLLLLPARGEAGVTNIAFLEFSFMDQTQESAPMQSAFLTTTTTTTTTTITTTNTTTNTTTIFIYLQAIKSRLEFNYPWNVLVLFTFLSIGICEYSTNKTFGMGLYICDKGDVRCIGGFFRFPYIYAKCLA